jgi:hypothetical protein
MTLSSRSKFLFKFVGHGIPKNAILIGIISLHRLPQRLEHFVITASSITPHGDQIYKETENAWRDSKTSAKAFGCQRKPAEFHSPLWSVMQFCYDYVLSLFVPRTRAHVKLYIGLFHSRRSEELSAFTVDGCRYVSIRVTTKNAISCKIILVQYWIWR